MAASSSIPVIDDDGQPPLTPQNDDDFKRFMFRLSRIFGAENESTTSIDAPENDCESPTIPTRNLAPGLNFSMSAPQNVASVHSDSDDPLVSQLQRLLLPPRVPLRETSSVSSDNNNSVIMAAQGCQQIQVELASDLWAKLSKMTNEMRISTRGSCIFPKLEFTVAGLDEQSFYRFHITFHRQDKFMYKYASGYWISGATTTTDDEPNIGPIPHLANAHLRNGAQWMQNTVSFRVKIANRPSSLPNVAVLETNHKYVPVIIISRFNLVTNDFDRIFEKKFPVAEFIAVTRYYNRNVAEFKIRTNPNMRRFRDSYQRHCQVNKENVPAAKEGTLPMNSSMFNFSNTTINSVPPQAAVQVKPTYVEPPFNSNMFGISNTNFVPPHAEYRPPTSGTTTMPSQRNQIHVVPSYQIQLNYNNNFGVSAPVYYRKADFHQHAYAEPAQNNNMFNLSDANFVPSQTDFQSSYPCDPVMSPQWNYSNGISATSVQWNQHNDTLVVPLQWNQNQNNLPNVNFVPSHNDFQFNCSCTTAAWDQNFGVPCQSECNYYTPEFGSSVPVFFQITYHNS